MQSLSGTNVLVTGGAVRIGRAIALAFARAGARVAVHYHHSASAAAELVRDLGEIRPGCLCVQADLCVAEQRQTLIPGLRDLGFAVNGLVNNASVYRRRALIRITPRELREDYEVNFVAPFELMQSFAVHCRRGVIINLLDQRVAVTDPGAGSYGLAKKSLRDVTEAAALQWAPEIRVNGVAPGLVLPPPGVAPEKMLPLLANVPMRRPSAPEEIAACCVFLAAADTITGQVLYVDGGLHLAPVTTPESGGALHFRRAPASVKHRGRGG